MKVKKVLNNNIILANDENLLEKMLVGKGIGYGKKTGEKIDLEKVEKIYSLESPGLVQKFEELARDIPVNQLELTNKIIEEAEKELECKFNDSLFIGLADHISYALYRNSQNEQIENALFWEVKKFYPKEFKAAMNSLKIIRYYENVMLSEDEASFIAIHFVNGQQKKAAISETIATTQIIQDVLNIVKFHYKIDLNEETLSYNRFVTHLRFFLQRSYSTVGESEDDFLFEQVKAKYPEAYACVLRIKTYLDSRLKINLGTEEMLYLMLHTKFLAERQIRPAN